ncbi:MAG: RhuM family protein [Coprobacillus cateniformis]
MENVREIYLSEHKLYQKVTDIYATAFDYNRILRLPGSFFEW